MGDASGPLAEVIRCDVAGEGLTRTSQNGTEVISGPLFSYLDERMKNVCVRADTPFSFQLGFVGYLGYEAKSETGGARSFVSQTPDAMLLFADRMIVFDHLQRRLYLVAFDHASTDVWFDGMHSALSTIEQSDDFAVVDLRDDDWSNESLYMRHSREQYLELIDRCQERIRDGESYEICLTNTFEFSPLEDPLATYLTLRSQNAAPMASYLRFSSLSILSASPERLVRVEEEGRVEAKPIKGTVRRGVTVDEDFELREHLCQDEKSRAENLMIVDLLRNDLGRVCVPGSVAVPSLFAIETFATLHHLVSTIVGKLDAQRSAVDCLRSIFPGGSMTGAPKIRTMQILDELETGPRGVYSGAIGYLSLNGSMDWSVVIRTIVNREHSATVGVGGAITALSDPDAEFDEMMLKATALRRAMMAGRGHLVGGVHASKA
jgi:para-aminobenzoate synthetase